MDLKEIYQPISRELFNVEKELKKQMNLIIKGQSSKNQKFVKQIISHIFNVPGKVLRPALVLLSAKAVNNLETSNNQQIIKLATAVEFIHSASLIHDDIIDESIHRRDQLTLNKQFDNQTAVMVGDILWSQFFSILISLQTIDFAQHDSILQIFCDTAKKMCFGEIYEHKIRKYEENPSLYEYLEVIEYKTASLFAASCQSGGMLNGADEKVSLALANYGFNLGLAFQIVDDYLDNDSIFTSEVDMIEKAKKYANRAKVDINVLKESPVKRKLTDASDYVVSRTKTNQEEKR